MGSQSTNVSLTALTCLGCRAAVKSGFLGIGGVLGALQKSGGVCPSCRHERFDAVFTVKRTYTESPSGGEIAAAAAFGLAGTLIIGGGSSGKSERAFDLYDLDGLLILQKMDLPTQETIDWILSVVKETVKANLAPDQGLCIQCGEIFVKGLAGHTLEGYCSPVCRKKHQRELPAVVGDAPAAPAAARAVDCPHCGRKVKVKPGGKCMFCGKVVPA